MSSSVRIVGYVPGDTDDVGFVNPVCTRENQYFIKVQDLTSSDTVEHQVFQHDFVSAEPTGLLSDPERVVLGFLINDQLFVGDIGALQAFVETMAQDYVATRPSLQLQIAELWGSAADRTTARKLFTSVLQQRLGKSASEYFVDSSLAREIVTSHILSNVKQGISKEKFTLSLRAALLRFHPHYDDPVPDTVWAELKEFLTIDKSELYTRFHKEWKPVSQSLLRDRGRGAAETDAAAQSEIAQEQFRSLSRLSRQERRIARLLRSYLEDRDRAERVSSIYRTNNKWESRALELVRSSLAHAHLRERDVEKQIAYLIPRLMKLEFPSNRGILLFDLAQELCVSRPIRDVIELELRRRSHTWAVHQFSEPIKNQLEAARDSAPDSNDVGDG